MQVKELEARQPRFTDLIVRSEREKTVLGTTVAGKAAAKAMNATCLQGLLRPLNYRSFEKRS